MSDEKPESAADRRPDDEPYYIEKCCNDCGEKLRPHYDIDDESAWFDEFECGCKGIHLDAPKNFLNKIKKRAEETDREDYIPVEELLSKFRDKGED